MRSVAIDAEHPGGRMEESRHVAAGDGLVVLHRVNLRGNTGAVPRGPVVVRPFNGHAQERVHVEFHDAAGPLVDVDVGIVGVGDGQEGVVHVLAGIVHRARHADEVTSHNGGGTGGTVAIGGHEQRVTLGDAHRGLKG